MGEEGPGAGPRAKGFSHARGWAGVQLLGRAVEAEGGPAGQKRASSSPLPSEAPRRGTPRQALSHARPGPHTLSIPKCLSLVSGLGGSSLAHHTPPSILSREAVSREEGGWGQGRRHPGRPPGLMQENLRVGKIPASHPQPRRILVPTETLRSPPR